MIPRISAISSFFLFLVIIGPQMAFAESGKAALISTDGTQKPMGQIALEDSPEGLHVTADLVGLTPGEHGFHIHEFGDCSDQGKAAGGHYNPDGAPHGLTMKDGPEKSHAGDMGNLTADEQGHAALSVVLPGVSLTTGAKTVAGRSVIVHEKMDDFGQPTGNAGGRVACGQILVTKGAA